MVAKKAATRTRKTPGKRATAKRTPAKATKKPAAKKTTRKRAPSRAPTKKAAPAKKASAPRRKKREPAKADVEGVVDQLLHDGDASSVGVVEKATRRELKLLKLDGTALGASALTLSRLADQAESGFAAATVLRELRMTLGTARTVGAISDPDPTQKKSEENVVPESRLEALRREAAARGRAK